MSWCTGDVLDVPVMYKHVMHQVHQSMYSHNNHKLMSFIQIDMILVLLDSEFFIFSIYAMII